MMMKADTKFVTFYGIISDGIIFSFNDTSLSHDAIGAEIYNGELQRGRHSA